MSASRRAPSIAGTKSKGCGSPPQPSTPPRLTRGLLLHGTRKICLLANEKNPATHTFYRTCGFCRRGVYDTLFLSTD